MNIPRPSRSDDAGTTPPESKSDALVEVEGLKLQKIQNRPENAKLSQSNRNMSNIINDDLAGM